MASPSYHSFLLNPGDWTGKGTVSFSASPDEIPFETSWKIDPIKEGKIVCWQEVKIGETEDPLRNHFQFSELTDASFSISLENEILGSVFGTGIIDSYTIAWEFRAQIGFQGYEVYTLEKDGSYSFHAEYASPDQFRTIIDGKIEKKLGKI